MRVSVYIDGFNLYYGALRDRPGRWLDVYEFSKKLLPKETYDPIVKYFTAPLVGRKGKIDDEHKRSRQQVYLRALGTIPQIQTKLGFFLTHKVFMRSVDTDERIRVWKSEEKGTDVKIASEIVRDGFMDCYDVAIVISNDSDLVEPIKIVKEELNKKVIVMNPFKRNAFELEKIASEHRPIRRWMIEQSQLPEIIQDEMGEITKPENW